ncbi:unnamed protein product [Linum trigynum]|uniref:Uncharacterized protein n=1 Tax=Linum trigynum TaxID=586398 RepID=A0AAV2DR30_9ROSI
MRSAVEKGNKRDGTGKGGWRVRRWSETEEGRETGVEGGRGSWDDEAAVEGATGGEGGGGSRDGAEATTLESTTGVQQATTREEGGGGRERAVCGREEGVRIFPIYMGQ